uniref:Uncharacterized protein n=1 Tax=Ditylum brightwellii TaxID=49249 RepID=A0A6U3NUH0_9STRA|mmetsp:Transcript_18700/g.24777  ORF Transcript_18700/g.24777 Transcript_18700/m.24777 type:complete len:304 (+) Transcript_18700:210-1121(+)
MKLSIALLLSAITAEAAFVPSRSNYARTQVVAKGYLDDLQAQMDQGKEEEEEEDDSHEATMMSKDQLDRYGPGSFDGFVDFDEFDGGDGQMGVAGDGSKGLEKMGGTPQFAKSKTMSAKNAWGSSTGYSDSLLERNPKMDVARAQQLENWMNQQEILKAAKEKKFMTDAFDAVNESAEMDWRELAKFGIQRNTESDLDEEFGAVVAGDISGVIDIHTQVNRIESYEISVVNEYMGFADFRAAFTPETPADWSVTPTEGSLSKEPVNFIVKFRPSGPVAPGAIQGHLIIETEDFKKTYQLTGST